MPTETTKAQIDQSVSLKPIHVHDLHRILNLGYADLVKSLETKRNDSLIVFELEQIEALGPLELQDLLEKFYLLASRTLGFDQVSERFREFRPEEPANSVLHEIQHAKKLKSTKVIAKFT